MDEIDVRTIKSHAVDNIADARKAASELGYPVIIRAAYALGGLGSGFCDNETELDALAEKAFAFSPQVLVEKSLRGWKEVEYEVVRDCHDNCITVCNMENFDPLGIHTGESIVVAPSQTLTNSEYHKLRELAIRIIRHIGIVGECNVQYALDPESEDYRVIEVNARLSRSSALASKATGYPLAFIAAKLGLGYGLFDLKNSVTRSTSAFFEPALDYVVCKIPRWDLGKFHGVDRELGSSMKSVGEVMAIGRTFEEAIQKGLRMIGQGMHGFTENKELVIPDIDKALREPTDKRIFVISKAFRAGYDVERIHELTKIDKWFLYKLEGIMKTSLQLHASGISDATLLRRAKVQGFSDFQIARAACLGDDMEEAALKVRAFRKSLGIVPVVKQIDTLGAEYPAMTNYLYLTYKGCADDIEYENDGRSVVVLGSGAYRIGSSVEFDWCGVQALNTVRSNGWRSVMINYNPETVSTDYDICDRLYFDELTFERVMDILEKETPHGVIVSTGGQIPNNLAMRLDEQGMNILGTSARSIDNAEDRDKFSAMLDRIGVDQPQWRALTSMEDIGAFVEEVGFPVLVRPSYVLGGRGMEVVYDDEGMSEYMAAAVGVTPDRPILIDRFLNHALECEADAISDGAHAFVPAVMEHIELAGIHSGDSACIIPSVHISAENVETIKEYTRKIAEEMHVKGLMNMQYAIENGRVYVLEANPRASRTVPLVSKVCNIRMVPLATEIITSELTGRPSPVPGLKEQVIPNYGVKEAVFPFNMFQEVDPVLGPEMRSTGEVLGLSASYGEAFYKAQEACQSKLPLEGTVLISVSDKDKGEVEEVARSLYADGFRIVATGGTYDLITSAGIPADRVNKIYEGRPNIVDLLTNGEIQLMINSPAGKDAAFDDSYLRKSAIKNRVPYLTTLAAAKATAEGIHYVKAHKNSELKSLQELHREIYDK